VSDVADHHLAEVFPSEGDVIKVKAWMEALSKLVG
jgi:hypothetical protein